MTYHICNNFNVSEVSTNDFSTALEVAQRIANRDNMPAWIDSADDTVKIEPNVDLSQMDQFRKQLYKIPFMDANDIKVEMSIIKTGRSEFTEIQQRMLMVRMDQYLVRQ